MAIQVRRGNEADFDASKMLPGEWAVSLDTKYVRMCFAPGVVLRMATYEGFEADKAQIQSILAECRSIQEVVRRIGNEVSEKASLTIEYSNSAKESAERAKIYADNAEAVTNVHIATKDRAGLVKGGDNHIAEDGTLMLITETTETTMQNSYNGRLLVEEIGGVCQQDSTSGKNLLNPTLQTTTSNGVTCTRNSDGTYTLKGQATAKTVFVVFTNNNGAFNGKKVKAVGCPSGGSDASYKGWFTDITVLGANDHGAGATLTPSTNELRYQIEIASGYTCNNLVFKPMISEDLNVTYNDFEAYTGGQPSPNPSYPQEIKKSVVSEIKTHGKNFARSMLPYTTTQWGVALYVDCDLQPSTQYTISFDGASGNTYYFNEHLFNGPEYVHVANGRTTATFTTKDELPKNASTYSETGAGWIFFKNSRDQLSDNVFTDLQLEKGSVATDYEPYTESTIKLSKPVELYGNGDVQDVIIPKEIKRKFAKVVLDGSDDENWQPMVTNTDGKWRNTTHFIKNSTKSYAISDAANLICTHCKSVPSNSFGTWGGHNGMSIDQSGILMVYDENFNTSDILLWKAHLQANPMTVVYELAEETTEELSLADQIALNSLATYGGITYLEFDAEIEPTFEGEYGTSKVGGYTLEGMLAGRNGELMGKNYADRITALESTVVNNI